MGETMTDVARTNDIGKCRACRATIRWVVLKSGKRNPLNLEPDRERGNVLIIREDVDSTRYGVTVGRALVLNDHDLQLERGRETPLYLSHFATCPARDQFRRRGS